MDRSVDLATELSRLSPRRGSFPWPNHEYVRGWGVFGLPFDSGHVLALRVFPDNDFAPYSTIWHRAPNGSWSIFADAPRLDIACPRYYGPACGVTAQAHIDLAERMYFIESSTAALDDVNLGRPTHLDEPPVIGNVTLPCRGVLAVGQAAWQIRDPVEYQRTRAETE